MFIRTTKAKGGGGRTYEYVRLVESYWEKGRTKQRVVATLGRKDLLAAHLSALVDLLDQSDQGDKAFARVDGVAPGACAVWGSMLVARTLWYELGLQKILDDCDPKQRRGGLRLSDRALVLVANRLCKPHSEHALADWLETDFACDRDGARITPKWKQNGRVRVEAGWLQQWYRTLDELIDNKARIERELFVRLRDLFALEPELVFYDLTSTYFEGAGPAGFALHGHSRDGKPRNRQVLVGVVMVNGWPIAHHVFGGNVRDEKTVPQVVEDLQSRFGLKRVVFVGDRGMVTTDNIALLKKNQQGYLVGLQRRRRANISELIDKATGPWRECPAGITASEKDQPPKTTVQEVSADDPGVRVFVVHSEERQAYERAMRERSMERTRLALEKLVKRVADGRLKAPEKIGAAAARILTRNHGHRYYTWELKDGRFSYHEHPVHLAREKKYEGKYLIQTEEKNLDPVEAVQAYKHLSDVERGFRELKDIIDLRPIYHHKKERVEGHIFVAALAFLLDRALEKKLKAAHVKLSSSKALELLRTVHVVDIDLGHTHKRGVNSGSVHARQILTAVGVTHREPWTTNTKYRPGDK